MAVLLNIRASTRGGERQVAVPAAVAGRLGLQGRQRLRLSVGSRTVPVNVQVHRAKGSVIRCHPKLLTALSLPKTNGVQLTARTRGRNIRLGPVIGIYTSSIRSTGEPFGQLTGVMEHLCRLGRRRGFLVYVFTPYDIRWQERRILGYEPAGRGWVRRSFPFPDVIYDRVPSRTAERRPIVRRTRARLQALVGHRYFNTGFFDKWEVHSLVSRDVRLRPHLPPTERYTTAARVGQLAGMWGGVWLKPSGGSLGRGIVVVRSRPGGGYVVFRPGGRSRKPRVASTNVALARLLKKYLKRGPYIVQRELNLARYQGRPFDIRLLMQRDGQGVWRRTKLYTRVARGGSAVTNISQGGEGLPFGKVAAAASGAVPQKAQEIMETMRTLSMILVEVIERHSNTTLGEIALDLGIDNDGHVWFIEANSKPIRAVETRKGSMAIVRRALVRPLLYAAYLSGFGGARAGVDR